MVIYQLPSSLFWTTRKKDEISSFESRTHHSCVYAHVDGTLGLAKESRLVIPARYAHHTSTDDADDETLVILGVAVGLVFLAAQASHGHNCVHTAPEPVTGTHEEELDGLAPRLSMPRGTDMVTKVHNTRMGVPAASPS